MNNVKTVKSFIFNLHTCTKKVNFLIKLKKRGTFLREASGDT